jgi:hypothetical protein
MEHSGANMVGEEDSNEEQKNKEQVTIQRLVKVKVKGR